MPVWPGLPVPLLLPAESMRWVKALTLADLDARVLGVPRASRSTQEQAALAFVHRCELGLLCLLLAWAPLADLVHELTVLLSGLRLVAWLWALVWHASAPVLSVSAQLLPLLSFLGVCSLSAWRHTVVLSMFPRGFQRQLHCPLYVCFFWLFPPCSSG